VAIIQCTFTQKQYTEEHNETEYLERNIIIIIIIIHKHNKIDISIRSNGVGRF